MILSILIPTLPEREPKLSELLNEVYFQIIEGGFYGKVEVISDDRPKGVTTGEKRNDLIERARGKYIWQIDDDDMIFKGAIRAALHAAQSDADCFAINGTMTTDGQNEKQWFIALENPYVAADKDGREIYLRYPNHITPIKREKVLNIKFPHTSNFEDKAWADAVKEAGVLQSQFVIEQPMYHYRYSNYNKTY